MGTPVVVCLLASSVASCVKAVCGFGEAILFIIILRACSELALEPFFDARETVALLVPIAMASNVYLTCTGWRDIDWWLVRRGAVPIIGGSIVGTQLLIRLEPGLIQRALGGLFLAFVALNVSQAYAARLRRALAHKQRKPSQGSEAEERRSGWQSVAAVATGALSGLFGGWFGVAGPPFMVYFSKFQTSKGAMRTSFVFLALLMNLPTVPTLVRAGLVESRLWPQYAAQVTGMIIGGIIGLRLHARVSVQGVMAVVYILLFFSSVAMLSADDSALALRIALACAAACALVLTVGELYLAITPRAAGLRMQELSDMPAGFESPSCRTEQIGDAELANASEPEIYDIGRAGPQLSVQRDRDFWAGSPITESSRTNSTAQLLSAPSSAADD